MSYDPTAKCTTCNHPRSAHGSAAFGNTGCLAGAGMLTKSSCDCKMFTPADGARKLDQATAK